MSKTTAATERMLVELGLPEMARELDNISRSPALQDMETFAIIEQVVRVQHVQRINSAVASLLHIAGLSATQADLSKIIYSPDRLIDKSLIDRLATCDYIRDNRTVYILGESGKGKSFIAQALGVEACRQQLRTKYMDTENLLRELDLLRKNDPKKYDRRFNFYKHFKVLILDDWMLTKISDTQATILFSLIRDRDQLATTIVCSQIRPDGWRKQIGPVALADAITRRIVDSGYLIYIDGSSAKSVC